MGAIQDFPSIAGTLIKQGAGTQTLSGINTYTGLTSIQNGILSITGSIVGDVMVPLGGTLKGTGTIGGAVNIGNGGILFPGTSIGTITLGSLTLNPESITSIEISPIASSGIYVIGNATIDGALHIKMKYGEYPYRGRYLILSAGNLNGTFLSIDGPEGYRFNLSSLDNDIYLSYTKYDHD